MNEAHGLTCRLTLDAGATFELGPIDDPDELVVFASDEGAAFMVTYIKAGDWVRMGRPHEVDVQVSPRR